MKRAAFAVILFLLTSEVLIAVTGADWRLLRPLLYYQAVDIPLHEPFSDPRLLYGLKKNASAVIEGRTITTNSFGFRDRERLAAKPPGVFRIVCLGSSNTYGALVNDGETYPARLEALLNARGGRRRYEVWNAGVSAYTLGQSAASAENIARDFDPDLLLIQLHSTKRRPFLIGRPVGRYFDADPELYLENLRFLPYGGAALLRHWRFARALVFAYNRLSKGPGNNPLYDGDGPSENALRSLVEKHGRRIPIVVLYNPGWHGEILPELGLKAVHLEKHLPSDFSADHLLIHPPAYVYRWYAEVLARELPLPR